jgi:N-acetylmuramoyl-L-alanine amidase
VPEVQVVFGPPAPTVAPPFVGPPAPAPFVGPPAPATTVANVPVGGLTPQDIIVMNAPRPAAGQTAVSTTTLPERAPSPQLVGPPPAAPLKPAPTRSTGVAAAQPMPLVVLDAGHGGRDPGAEGVGGVIEKDVVLALTRVLAKRLTSRLRVNVLLTRSDDSYLPIDRRLTLPSDATLFVSLHANACPDPSARGLEIFYGGGGVRPADTSGASPQAALLGRYLDEALSARVGGVRGSARLGAFGILSRNPLPSALIEIGYLTHPEEAALSQDPAYQALMADAVVDGLDAYLRAAAPLL